MKYTHLGDTALKVSKICLGTMTWGEQNTEREAHEQLNYAVENGVNFIDTAEMYAVPSRAEVSGLTEKYIGTWLKTRKDRDKLVIASKIVGPGKNVRHVRKKATFSKAHLTEALNGSLKRLQTDYIDLYQLHWPERPTNYFGRLGYEHVSDEIGTPFNEIIETLKGFMDQGKIRYYGLSNETPWGTMAFIREAEKYGLPKPVSVQNPYSLLNRTYEVGMAEISIREKAGLLAYSPLAFGLLSGKYRNGASPANARITLFGHKLQRYNGMLTHRAADLYTQIAETHGLSPAQMALAYVNSREFVTSNIIGATTMEQLKENIGSIELMLLEEVLEKIEEVHQLIPNPAP